MPRAAFRRRTLSLTPLVDVIFLLLLFFMLTSTFSRYAEVELSAAAAGSRTQASDTQFLQLGETRLRLAGREIALEILTETLANATVLVSLETDVTAQRLIDLMGTLRAIPGISVTVLR